jgi:hypothetical protein
VLLTVDVAAFGLRAARNVDWTVGLDWIGVEDWTDLDVHQVGGSGQSQE